MSFVSSYLEHTQLYESPTSFWKWSAYAAIGAILRDNVYRKQGDITTYPNIFVLFLAPSGGRKGAPINLARELIKIVGNTKDIAGRTSIQAIIDELSHTETNSKTGKLVKGGSAILIASELAAGIVGDSAAISILTDLYDLKTDFKHHLRSTGRFKIDRIVLNMLAGSNADLLKEVYTEAAVNGGLLARTFLIFPNEIRPPNSLLDAIDTSENKIKLAEQLKKISELTGQVHITDEAKKEYDEWYKPFYNGLTKKSDKSGILARIHTGIFKLAIILAANDLEMSIRKCHIEQAIEEGMGLIPNYNTFVMASGKSTLSEAGAILIPLLLESKDHMVSKKKFLQDHWHNVDNETFDKLIITLEAAGLVQSIMQGTSGMFYRLTEKALEKMREKQNGQSNGKT